ncbi:MAG: response regulator [Elusimicrobia bacterium]|nr:response regulator [Elusimicrobiota bacterium]
MSSNMKVRVLVVDDEVNFRKFCEWVLRQQGCEVVSAGTSGDALLSAASGVDWVLTDLHLPDQDGFWLARQLRDLYPDLKIVLATGSAADSGFLKEAEALKLCLLIKPFNLEDLINVARRFSFGP